MNRILTTIVFLLIYNFSFSQIDANTWQWISGSKTINQVGIYGQIGVPAASNIPGARFGYASWTDGEDYFMFGGSGFAQSATVYNLLADIWKYNTTTNTWTWLKGTNIATQSASTGIYGVKGVESSTNAPGARTGMHIWYVNNVLYMFGGYAYDANGSPSLANDLWKYDPVSNNWTWINGPNLGNSTGSFGTINVPDANNLPPSRSNGATWHYNNKLYLFGGTGVKDDLWEYDIASNIWTWRKGSNQVEQNGVYGTKGIENMNNKPGGRAQTSFWQKDDRFFVFGGIGKDESNRGYLNDLWEFNLTTNNWKWIAGSKYISTPTVTSFPQTSVNDSPGGRNGSSFAFFNNKFINFGGFAYFNANNTGLLNDVWLYHTEVETSKYWQYIKGSLQYNQPTEHGNPPLLSNYNTPGGRQFAKFTEIKGKLYLFGGSGYDKDFAAGYLNDFWVYVPKCDDFYTVKSGNWTDPTVWICNRVPETTDKVKIDGHNITINTPIICRNVDLLKEGKIIVETGGWLILDNGN
jgi:N-acetylneuraminic acid mutarotase